MAIGNRFELIDFQTLLQQDVLNVYYYRQISGLGGGASELIDAWFAELMADIVAVQGPDLQHIAIGAKNLDVPTDFALSPLSPSVGGTIPGEACPPYVCWAFRMNRQQTDVHHGAKRIAGVTTGSINDGAAAPALTAPLNTVAAGLAVNLTGASLAVYEPRIMRRLLDAQGHLIGYQDFPMGSVQYVRLSTQNTRKFGRGS